MNKEDFLKEITEILEIDSKEISMDTDFKSLPEWDSLKAYALIVFLEEHNININYNDIEKFNTINDIYELVNKAKN